MGAHSIDLREVQRQLLTTLVNQYQQQESPVKADALAELLNRDTGTIRNKMPQLTSLGLVEGVPGPGGGYEPTEKGFEALDRDPDAEREATRVTHEFERVDATVENISFTNVNHPTDCRAWIEFQTALPHVDVGDPIIIGPTADTQLVIAGEIHSLHDRGSRISLDIRKLEAPFAED
ncbi:HTH domain-containing protein [Halosimplex sp. TS25]|uniref:HTH domain-containing protein n=1 Tax=Halosimplex rarum TaxID=3396619 RepID=UPI0039ECD4DF